MDSKGDGLVILVLSWHTKLIGKPALAEVEHEPEIAWLET
jgi:hypothetical protein